MTDDVKVETKPDVKPDVKVDETAGFETFTSDEPKTETEDKPDVKVDDKKEVEKKADKKVTDPESKKVLEKKSSDDAAAGVDTTDDKAKPKGKGRVQKRITKLVSEREEQRQKANDLEKQNESLKQQIAGKRTKAEDKSEEPKEGDFDTYDEYLDALEKHQEDSPKRTEKKAEPKAEPKVEPKKDEKQKGLSDTQQTAMAIVQDFVQDAENKPSDFDDVALADDVDITGEMLEALAECEDPMKVMYHLGKNKDLASDIAAKTPVQQMREITRLDLSVKLKPEKPVKKTNAADPIVPVKGSDSQEKDINDLSFNEYEKRQNKKQGNTGFW